MEETPKPLNPRSFANFKFEKEDRNYKLPIKDQNEAMDKGISYGAYTSVIDIGDGKVAKISRISRFKDGVLDKQYGHTKDYLAEKSEDPKADTKRVADRILKYAQVKQEAYEILGQYIGEFMPEVLFYAVVESPRRELERRMHLDMSLKISEEQLKGMPTSEASLMEVWEKVDLNNEIESMSADEVTKLYSNSEFAHEYKRFADSLFALLIEKKVMVDICDDAGIRVRSKKGHEKPLYDLASLKGLDLLSERGSVAVTRNLTFDKGRIRLYDVYPNKIVDESIDNEMVVDIIQKYKGRNWEALKEIVDAGEQEEGVPNFRLYLLRYIALLQYMGSSLEVKE